MFRRILLVYSEKISPGHQVSVRRLRERLASRIARVVRSHGLKSEHFRGVDLVMTVGGDGAFIRAARFTGSEPIIGVNSEPEFSEGALASVRDDETEALAAILEGEYRVLRRRRARVALNGVALAEPALNEVFVGARYQFHTSRYIVEYRGESEEQRSSGVLVVTGSGSRAWYSAGGGRPFSPRREALRFLVREPFRGRVFRPRLLAGEIAAREVIAFESRRHRGGVVALDANTAYPFNRGDRVEVGLSAQSLSVLEPK